MSHRFAFQLVLVMVLTMSGCGSTPEDSASSRSASDPPSQSPPANVGGAAPGSESPPGGSPPEPAAEKADWQVYRSDEYGLELRYPSDYALLSPGGEPQPQPAFRLWFGEETKAGSPLAGRMPPPFAVDIYDNAEQRPLREWLEAAGVSMRPDRRTLTPVEVAGREGLLLALSAQLAPNAFYYVAAGPYVYRFTPLGPSGDEILKTVNILWDR